LECKLHAGFIFLENVIERHIFLWNVYISTYIK